MTWCNAKIKGASKKMKRTEKPGTYGSLASALGRHKGLMCLWELQDNTGRSPSLIRFSYQRWPLKMYEDIDVKGGIWRYSHWRLWQEKTSHEAYGARRLRSFIVLFILCWVIGTTVLLSGVQVNKVRVTEVILNKILCLRAKTMRANLIQSRISQLYL